MRSAHGDSRDQDTWNDAWAELEGMDGPTDDPRVYDLRFDRGARAAQEREDADRRAVDRIGEQILWEEEQRADAAQSAWERYTDNLRVKCARCGAECWGDESSPAGTEPAGGRLCPTCAQAAELSPKDWHRDLLQLRRKEVPGA
jgi:hypothetical protein